MQNSSRIIINTGILYGKMFINIGIALFSTRLILNALGASDFGIFALVGGVIGALSFLNKSMASATQRFLSYNRGKGPEQMAKVFNTAIVLHVLIGLLFAAILEVAGIFLFDGFLNIPAERISVAKFVFHCMVASTFFSVIAVPYDAIMNAKENMIIFSLFSILESIFKLAIGIWLYYTPVDRLATYGLCMALSMVICRTAKRVYSRLHYPESRLSFKNVDTKLMKEMGAYSGWVTVESVSHIAKGEGIPIILNIFFGTVVNAAYGVATQVRQNIGFFSEMIFRSSNPQLMKNLGEGNLQKGISISFTSCKFSFLLMALLSIPLIVKADYILELWLRNVPENAAFFCQLILTTNLIIMLARGLNFLIDGIGKIRNYRIILSVTNIIVFPLAYGMLYMGMAPASVFIAIIISDILVLLARIYFANRYSSMGVMKFCKATIFRLLPLSLVAGLASFAFSASVHIHDIVDLILCALISSTLLCTGFYTLVINDDEKSTARNFVKKAVNKITGKKRS